MTRRTLRRRALVLALCAAFLGACASGGLDASVRDTFASPQIAGAQWGLMVADADGEEILAINADNRFLPASNIKVLTSAAALYYQTELELPARNPGTRVFLEFPSSGGDPDVVLVGGGDAALGDGPDCIDTCLATLADEVVAAGVKEVRHVIGDDRMFPDERWGLGWSWEDLQWRYGAAVSALTVNDNSLGLRVAPGDAVGDPIRAHWAQGDDLFELDIAATTQTDAAALQLQRPPGAATVRVAGGMEFGAPPKTRTLALEDPPLAAAQRFQRLLEARGVRVSADAQVRRRQPAPPAAEGAPLAISSTTPQGLEAGRLAPSPLLETLIRISKDSENLSSEIIVRRLGLIDGDGSTEAGLALINELLLNAGVSPNAFDLADGSGLSIYNRISPRAMVRFLTWASDQTWGETLREIQPIGGVDGTLEGRFIGTPLKGAIFAKTGTLFGVNALSGYMRARSGRMLTFAVFVNDRPASTPSAIAEMDAVLALIAAAN